MDEHHLVPGRTRPRLTAKEYRRPHVDERQRHELGEAPCAFLDLPYHLEMIGPGGVPKYIKYLKMRFMELLPHGMERWVQMNYLSVKML